MLVQSSLFVPLILFLFSFSFVFFLKKKAMKTIYIRLKQINSLFLFYGNKKWRNDTCQTNRRGREGEIIFSFFLFVFFFFFCFVRTHKTIISLFSFPQRKYYPRLTQNTTSYVSNLLQYFVLGNKKKKGITFRVLAYGNSSVLLIVL